MAAIIINLKKKLYHALLACGTPVVADMYQQARQSVATALAKAKIQAWEKWGYEVWFLNGFEKVLDYWFKVLLNPIF